MFVAKKYSQRFCEQNKGKLRKKQDEFKKGKICGDQIFIVENIIKECNA